MTDSDLARPDRRRLLAGAAVLGVAAPLIAACGADDPTSANAPDEATTPSDTGSSTEPSDGGDGGDGGAELVAAADVPVGGGVVLDAHKVVVTQPTEGQFKAFTAVCTHQGCLVSTVEDNTIGCPCHGSQFSAEDGAVVGGPASAPLTPVEVEVQRGSVVKS